MRQALTVMAPVLCLMLALAEGCPSPPPMHIENGVLGAVLEAGPDSPPAPPITLVMEVPDSELEKTLSGLTVCTPMTFGPFPEDPNKLASPTFSITCHVTAKQERGISVECKTNGDWCTFSIVTGERSVKSGCTTPTLNRPIFIGVAP